MGSRGRISPNPTRSIKTVRKMIAIDGFFIVPRLHATARPQYAASPAASATVSLLIPRLQTPPALTRPSASVRRGLANPCHQRRLRASSGEAFAHLEARETADDNLIAQLLGNAADVFLDGHFGIPFDKPLVHQADALKKLLQLAFDDLGDGLRRLVLDLFSRD